jgi:DNA polymerase-3 subunit gamma/tau
MSLTCEKRIGIEPCGECESCIEIMRGVSDYFIEVDGATNGKVEDVRNLMASIGYYVPEKKYKVVLIDECHSLTQAAWNASLKTIEVPPARVLFVFSTTEIAKVVATAKSRCVPVQFPGVTDDVIISMLKNILEIEKKPYDEEALKTIAKEARGSIRDAQSILEGFIRFDRIKKDDVCALHQTLDFNTIVTYFNSIIAKDTKAACATTGGWIRLGVAPELVITGLMEHLQNMLLDFIVIDSSIKGLLKAQRDKIGDSRIASWVDFFYEQIKYIREFPMAYSLVMNLMTIKLVDSLNIKIESKSNRKKADEIEEKKEAVAAVPEKSRINEKTFLNKDWVNKMEQVCKGRVIEVTPDYRRVTITNEYGTTFDVVTDESLARTGLFLLGEDVPAVVADYPNSMDTYIKEKQ